MGNQWLKDYDIDKKEAFVAGVNGLWKVHNAKKQKEESSVFIIDKRTLKMNEKESIVVQLRKEAQKLSQLKHPNVLSVLETPAEDPKRLLCACEKIVQPLSKLMLSNEQMTLLDVKLHMLELIEAVCFVHNDAKLVHLNISPENIYVCPQRWKLGGFMYSIQQTTPAEIPTQLDLQPKNYEDFITLRPSFKYMAPEVTLGLCSFKSDIFSIGIIFLELLRFSMNNIKGNLFDVVNLASYKQTYDGLLAYIGNSQFFNALTDDNLKGLLLRMIGPSPQRPSIVELYHNEFFMDPLVKLMVSMKSFNTKDNEEQLLILKAVSKNLFKFEPAVLRRDLLPIVTSVKNESLAAPLIFILIDLSKIFDLSAYMPCWNALKKLTELSSMSAQALFALVSSLKHFSGYKMPKQELMILVPLYLKCLETDVPKLQQLALQQTIYVIQLVDYVQTKSQILPKVLSLCQSAENSMLAIEVLRDTHHLIDPISLLEQVLPTLGKMKTNITDETATILLEIYQKISSKLTPEQICNLLIPQLLPFLLNASYGLKFADLLHSLVDSITANFKKSIIQEQHPPPIQTEQFQYTQPEYLAPISDGTQITHSYATEYLPPVLQPCQSYEQPIPYAYPQHQQFNSLPIIAGQLSSGSIQNNYQNIQQNASNNYQTQQNKHQQIMDLFPPLDTEQSLPAQQAMPLFNKTSLQQVDWSTVAQPVVDPFKQDPNYDAFKAWV